MAQSELKILIHLVSQQQDCCLSSSQLYLSNPTEDNEIVHRYNWILFGLLCACLVMVHDRGRTQVGSQSPSLDCKAGRQRGKTFF